MTRKAGIVLLLLMISCTIYVVIENRNSKNMTTRQKLLKAVYPLMMWFTNATSRNTTSLSNIAVTPVVPLYTLPAILNDGRILDLNDFKGKKILLVNTASDCGYTGQYEALEKLHREYKDNLVVLGFPANDFKEQEKGTDESIEVFCKLNFGLLFSYLKKVKLLKEPGKTKYFNGYLIKIKMDGMTRHRTGIFANTW